jgi:hypothetical protein
MQGLIVNAVNLKIKKPGSASWYASGARSDPRQELTGMRAALVRPTTRPAYSLPHTGEAITPAKRALYWRDSLFARLMARERLLVFHLRAATRRIPAYGLVIIQPS